MMRRYSTRLLLRVVLILSVAITLSLAATSPHPSLSLTPEEIAWLKAHPVIPTCSDTAWAPVEFIDKQGTFTGIAQEYLHIIGTKLGITFDPYRGSWEESELALQDGKLVLASAIRESPERAKYLDFTETHLPMPIAIFAGSSLRYVSNVDLLEGNKIAVVKGYAIEKLLRKHHPRLTLVTTPSTASSLKMVAEGKVDALIDNGVCASYYIGKLGLTEIRMIGITDFDFGLRIAVRKDQPLLYSAVSKALASISEQERNAISQRWISLRQDSPYNYRIFIQIGIGIGILISLFIAWIVTLRILVKQRTEALKQSEQNLKATLASIGDGVIVSDIRGHIILMNAPAESITGLSTESTIGQDLRAQIESLCVQNSSAGCEALEAVFALEDSTIPVHRTIANIGKEGTKTISFSAAPIKSTAGTCIGKILVLRDLSEHVTMEARMHQSEKMEALGRLSGGIAHDFNNMLGGIIGGADFLADSLKDRMTDTERSMLDIILQSSTRAGDLIAKLMAFSRKAMPNETIIHMHKIINDAQTLLTRSLDRKITFVTDLEAETDTVLGDSGQLQNAIINLCINAGDAMPNGGTITISTAVFTSREIFSVGTSFTLQAGRYFLCTVADSGCGIPHEIMTHLFEPFYTTKGPGKGTGLGLAAVHGMAQSHRGAISVESTAGTGTKFHIYLPIADAPEDAHEVNKVEDTKHSGTILVVDDEEVIRATTKAMLEKLGYHVYTAINCTTALSLYTREHARIDLVITDMIMPVMNGIELHAELRKINPGIKALLSSGYIGDNTPAELAAAGFSGFLRKPFTMKELSALVSSVLRPSRQ